MMDTVFNPVFSFRGFVLARFVFLEACFEYNDYVFMQYQIVGVEFKQLIKASQ